MITKSHLESPHFLKALSEYQETHPGQKAFEPSEKDQDKISTLIEQGYIRLARKERIVGKLPDGQTGLETLAKYNPDRANLLKMEAKQSASYALKRAEETATKEVLTFYLADDNIKLTIAEYNAWLKKDRFSPLAESDIVFNLKQRAYDASKAELLLKIERLEKEIAELKLQNYNTCQT